MTCLHIIYDSIIIYHSLKTLISKVDLISNHIQERTKRIGQIHTGGSKIRLTGLNYPWGWQTHDRIYNFCHPVTYNYVLMNYSPGLSFSSVTLHSILLLASGLDSGVLTIKKQFINIITKMFYNIINFPFVLIL